MALGSPQTDKFPIGTAEIRIGELDEALKHLPSHSLGQFDDVTISITNNAVQKRAGFPQRIVANAITENLVTVSGTMGEYSRRNMQILAGEAPEPLAPDVSAVLQTAAASGSTSLELATGDGANFVAGQLIVIYIDGRPEMMQVSKIASITADTLTLEADKSLLHAYPAVFTRIFSAQPIGRAITKTNYFSMQVIQSQFSDGRPIAWNFWKASSSSGLEAAMNATDFSTAAVEFQCLEPSAKEFQVGGPLEHVADEIIEFPVFLCAPGG